MSEVYIFGMAKRRMSKKQRQKRLQKQIISAVVVIVLAILGFFLEPWQYLPGEEKPNVGSREELETTDLQVHYIDMGQADSILVRVPADNGMLNMLIDAGTSKGYGADVLTGYLEDLGILSLDYFVITHPDGDHILAADEVIEQFEVKKFIMTDYEKSTSSWERVLTALDKHDIDTDIITKAGDTYHMGEASFKILGPVDSSDTEDVNNASIVLRLVYGETSFLFTGDAEGSSEEQMLAKFPASDFRADVLKIGHHGARKGTTEAFLKAVDPSLAVILCGKDNDYGHPTSAVLDRLTAANVEILRTDLEGTIIIGSDKKEVYRLTSN